MSMGDTLRPILIRLVAYVAVVIAAGLSNCGVVDASCGAEKHHTVLCIEFCLGLCHDLSSSGQRKVAA
jgi:hypothetical protein